ncbi:MAG: tol-pal system protein YbgF [Betaproteobacteria bacterium]|nr:tol-pal system protein YbgF [Betaproteobacteria bacterium]
MRSALKLTARASLLALSLGALGSAQAALFEDDEARRAILDLRQRVEATNHTVKAQAEGLAQMRRVLLDMQEHIDALRAELSKSRGSQEQLARDVSEVQLQQRDAQSKTDERLRDAQSKVDERLRRFEPVTVKLDGQEFQAEQNEKREYENAFETFRKGDFAAAQELLQRFVQSHPKSGYLPSALFWLGNAAYANKDYKDALAQFRQMLSLAPAHPRAPEAMLASANVQLELKNTKAARKALEDVVKHHPQSDAAQTAKDRLSKLR